jgi:phage gp36-like protein
MPYPYIDQEDLSNRISANTVRRIYDDSNVGQAEDNAVQRLIEDSSAKVAGSLRGQYDLGALEASTPNEVKRITLDVAQAYAAQRHPEIVRQPWKELMDAANFDLKQLREGKTRLDVVGTPEPPSTAEFGAAVASGAKRWV